MSDLINNLKSELYAKPSPGLVLNQIADAKLLEFANKYQNHDHQALWIGSYLSDMYITEAIKVGDINKHVPMAIDRAKALIKEENINNNQAEIIFEIISTHHGGEQKHIESKLFKNADCFKFLMPRGVFHIFGAMYGRSTNTDPQAKFKEAMQYTMYKVEEKIALVDLDEATIKEAQELYDHWQFFFSRTGVSLDIPDLYSSK